MNAKPLLLLDCYTDEADGLSHYTPWLAGAPVHPVRVVDAGLPQDPRAFQGVVVTGSAASAYDDRPWIAPATQLLARALQDDVPVLGVCFGHQLLGRAVGGPGTVVRRSAPEVGYLSIAIDTDDCVLGALPSRFRSFLTHIDEVRPVDGLEIVGRSDACANQAMRVVDRRAWSIQFHVEYPPEEQLRLLHRRARLHPELGLDAEAEFSRRVDTSGQARAIFDAFLEVCR